jgi:NTE family protein
MEVGMAYPARTALVLQGGGALGAYELGAARRLYKDEGFAPDVIAGVSIGAITAVLLARPATGLKPLEALEAFWQKITVSGLFLPPPFRPYASVLGNPNFFVPRLDYYALPAWTNIYDTEPLRQTLSQLIDLKALADPKAAPGLLVSATDVEAGEIAYFYSQDKGLSLDHIVASGSLPPSFPMTLIGDKFYWDGGLFDNTPLGAVLDRLEGAAGADRAIYVVNLFPNKAPVPRNMQEVTARTQNLQFANKTLEDVKMLRRIDEVADFDGGARKSSRRQSAQAQLRLSSRGEAPLRPGPANRFDHASGRGFGLWGQRFLARDNRTARERRLQADRVGAASIGDRRFGF